ncbi:MAG: 2-oxoglutarate dehydrogenase E1 subunit family protein, partial [Thermoanaerobaculia bacterium]
MSATSPYGTNIAFIEELYDKFKQDPESVSASWREFFEDYEPQPELEEEGEGEEGQPWQPEPVAAQWVAQPAGREALAREPQPA